MLALDELVGELGYTDFPENWQTGSEADPATAHLLRAAREIGVQGFYVYHTSPPEDQISPPRPAVFVAQADMPDEARKIHRKLWNLGTAPFLIVVLPCQVRVYTGFDFDQEDDRVGLLENPRAL